MADENPTPPNGGRTTTPRPDPTELTDRAIARSELAMRTYVDGQIAIRDERLRGIDTATNLRLGSVDTFSDETDYKVGRLAEVVEEKFHSIEKQFAERDTRAERESRDNKLAVDAAFAAQEKLAIAQQASNAEAIDKSERATAETIKTNMDLTRATIDALTKNLDEVKVGLTRIESAKTGAIENRTANTESRSSVIAVISVVTLVVGTVVGVVVGILAASP